MGLQIVIYLLVHRLLVVDREAFERVAGHHDIPDVAVYLKAKKKKTHTHRMQK